MTYSILTAQGLVYSVLNLFGIYGPPQTVLELVWDVFVLLGGFFIVKYVMIFVISVMREALRMR